MVFPIAQDFPTDSRAICFWLCFCVFFSVGIASPSGATEKGAETPTPALAEDAGSEPSFDSVEPTTQAPAPPEHPERAPRDPSKSLPKAAKSTRAKFRRTSGPLDVTKRLPIPGKPGRNLPPLGEEPDEEDRPDDEAADEPSGEAMAPPGEEPDGLFRRLPHNLRDGGITAAYIYTGETFHLAKGGIGNRRMGNYRGNLDIVVSVDTEKSGLWKGGRLFVYGENLEGRPLSKDFVGDVQLFSNLDSTVSDTGRPYFAAIAAYWYEHAWFDGKLRGKIGKQDSNVDFAYSDIASDFVHSTFGLSPNIPLPTFPSQALGVSFFWKATDNATLAAGVFDGSPAFGPQGTQWGFSTLGHGGANSVVQLEYQSQTGPGGEHPGTIRAGMWHNSNPDLWTEFAVDEPRTFNQNYGVFCNVDQMIWKESYFTDSDQGLGVFFLFSGTPQDRNQIQNTFAYGFSYKGLARNRDDDILGFGVSVAELSGEYRQFMLQNEGIVVKHSETAFELFYKYRHSKFIALQPDLQFIARPSGRYRDALLPGLRFQMLF